MMKSLLMSLFFVLLFQTPSQAGILFEPYIGYESGSINYKFKGAAGVLYPETYKDTATGAAYGGKLGFTFPFFFFGVDANLFSGTQKYDPKLEASPAQQSLTRTTIYALAGINLYKVRLWLGYSPSDQMITKESGTEVTYSGTAMRLGLGYMFVPHFSLNFEYDTHTVTDSTVGGSQRKMDDYFSQFTYNAFMVSASFPFVF